MYVTDAGKHRILRGYPRANLISGFYKRSEARGKRAPFPDPGMCVEGGGGGECDCCECETRKFFAVVAVLRRGTPNS